MYPSQTRHRADPRLRETPHADLGAEVSASGADVHGLDATRRLDASGRRSTTRRAAPQMKRALLFITVGQGASQPGVLAPFAGTGGNGFIGDGGPATSAVIGYPTGISVHPNGLVFFVDSAVSARLPASGTRRCAVPMSAPCVDTGAPRTPPLLPAYPTPTVFARTRGGPLHGHYHHVRGHELRPVGRRRRARDGSGAAKSPRCRRGRHRRLLHRRAGANS